MALTNDGGARNIYIVVDLWFQHCAEDQDADLCKSQVTDKYGRIQCWNTEQVTDMSWLRDAAYSFVKVGTIASTRVRRGRTRLVDDPNPRKRRRPLSTPVEAS